MKSYKKAVREWLITICLCLFIAGLSIWVVDFAFNDYPFFGAVFYIIAFLIDLYLIAHQLGKSTRIVAFSKIGKSLMLIIALLGETNKLILILIYAFMLSSLIVLPASFAFIYFLKFEDNVFLYVYLFSSMLLWYGFGRCFVRCAIKLILHSPSREKQREAYERISNFVLSNRNIKIIIYLFNFIFLVFYSVVEISGKNTFEIGFFANLLEIKEIVLYSFLTIVAFDALINLVNRNNA